MSKLGSLYIELGEPEGELCGCTCEVGDWAADEIVRLRDKVAELEKKLSDALAAYKRDVEDICP